MPDAARDPVELATVDPDEQQFRADSLLMHAELLELELYKIRREMFSDPGLVKVNIGAGNSQEQTIRGFQGDPYNGAVVYNPTPATLSVGFQAGTGLLAPATVPPFSWATFQERYVNLSIALLSTTDQQSTIALPVTISRTRIPPPPGAGPFTSPVPQQPLVSLPAGTTAVGGGAALDNGYPRANHSLFVAAPGVTGGVVQLQVSNDGNNWAAPVAVTTNAPNSYQATYVGPFRYVRASVSVAITGGSVTATVASA